MMIEQIDRKKYKWEAADLLWSAQVSPKAMTALYLALLLALELMSSLGGNGFLGIFISIFVTLLSSVLAAGFVMYCMAIRRGERAEYLTLFDGFSFVGKLILLNILIGLFVFLWSLLFVIPGIIAAYRYRFALYNLYENPGIGPLDALDMSKQQTPGYKAQLFMLDLSYIGWNLLASLPTAFLSTRISQDMAGMILYGASVPETYFGLPMIVLDLLFGLWELVVCLFYYPNYICVELAYFETAKRTSGTGEGVTTPSPWDGWNPPDGLS